VAAESNPNRNGVMENLLDRKGYRMEVTEAVVLAAANTEQKGPETIALPYKWEGNTGPVTNAVLKAKTDWSQNSIVLGVLKKNRDQ
jgi:hypothetical protein